MDQIDPEELARRASQRDRQAFGQLYEQHSSTVYRYVFYKVSNGTLAEDLTGDVFSKAWERIDRFEWRNIEFEHWLLRIARNVVIDHWRANKRSTQPLDDLLEAPSGDLLPEEHAERNNQVNLLRGALARLPDEQRDVVILRFIEGYSHQDVATVLGKSIVAVRQIQVRALLALRKLLGNQGEIAVVSRNPRDLRRAAGRVAEPVEKPTI